jgi:sugar O-acyltransferase (sialic acid O-acetyltransferase NeuD family)
MHIDESPDIERILIVGAGGHAKVVVDAIMASRIKANVCFVDDDPATYGSILLNFPVLGNLEGVLTAGDVVHVAIGNNLVRERMFLKTDMARFLRVIHPAACVSQWASLGSGSFVAATAVVGPDAGLGRGVIVNHGAIVDHDCEVGDFSHIAPGASLAGNVKLGVKVMVGAGARILPGIHIGDEAVVGAGAIVVSDVAAGVIVKGVPAKETR